MSTETYAIVFRGETVEGFDAAQVQAQLAKLLRLDPKKAQALFSGKQVVLKKTADKAEAAKYGKALKKVGADVKIRVIKAEPQPATQSPPPAQQPTASRRRRSAPAADAAPVFQAAEDAPAFQKADDAPAFQPAEGAPVFAKADTEPEPAAATAAKESAATADTSGFSLAPNVGDLFDPAPEVEAPAIDLSEYEVSEMDDTPLAVPAEEVILELDLSEFSVSENDGSPLFESTAKEVPRVEAPDFGLDEPGAILDTIKEEKELLNPNTMGMTIAAAGVDLIEEDEKPPAPAPKVPDTSNIHLVPNFDS